MTNEQRAQRGAQIINARMDAQPELEPSEAAVDIVIDMLHSLCDGGDELAAEALLTRAKVRYIAECDRETGFTLEETGHVR